MPAINFNFISNNIKGLQLTKNRIKLFDYFISKLAPSGFLFASGNSFNQGNQTKMKR